MKTKREREDPEATQVVSAHRLEAVGDQPAEEVLPAGRRSKVALYSVIVSLASTTALALLVSYAWYLRPGDDLAILTQDLQRYALAHTLFTMMTAGIAGGALANLREFLRIGRRREGLPVRLELPLYLRPLSGGVMAVLVFFLLQFFVAVLSVGATTQGWALLHGRLAYVAVALVVGFSVQDLEKLRDLAAALVSRDR